MTNRTQFSLAALFEHITVCTVPLAFAPTLGIAASLLMMGMGLALGFHRGWLALCCVIGASVTADIPSIEVIGGASVRRQLLILGLATVLCVWYVLRRRKTR